MNAPLYIITVMMQYYDHDNFARYVMTKKKAGSNRGGIIGLGALSKIEPEQIALLQKGVFDVVKQNLPRVREVLTGHRQWNPQQVKLYLAMLNKVMPDLSQSHNTHDHSKSVDEMTPDELRAVVADEISKREAAAKMPTNDPDVPMEITIAHQMNDPLLLTDLDPTSPETIAYVK